MTHFIREKQKLLARIRRKRGQVEAVERALKGEAEYDPITHLIAGMRGAISGLTAEVIENHVREHLTNCHDSHGGYAAEQLVESIRTT